MFKSKGILLLGVKSRNDSESGSYEFNEIFINPMDYIIQETDQGIVLAKDVQETTQLWAPDENLILAQENQVSLFKQSEKLNFL